MQKKISAGMGVLEHVDEPLRSALMEHDIVRALNIPGLEEEPTLLESRLNLMRYATESVVPEERRERLWRDYHVEFVDSLPSVGADERRRQPPLSQREWARREGELGGGKQETLFP
jgi:hypothetical protein